MFLLFGLNTDPRILLNPIKDEERPGSELAAGTAAAMAAASMLLREDDPAYAQELVKHARDLFEFADRFRDYYHRAIPDAENFYKSSGFGDELTWAALWIYYASNDGWFLKKAEEKYAEFALHINRPFSYFWDDVTIGVNILLSNFATRDPAQYARKVEDFCDSQMKGGKEAVFTPKGLRYIHEWAPIRYSMNVAFICGIAADQVCSLSRVACSGL